MGTGEARAKEGAYKRKLYSKIYYPTMHEWSTLYKGLTTSVTE